ncbi:TMV resistance protein N-like isoform X2 [Vigna unguiculata]|uniref:TMV resistance protein N-like isoform X2 n=1 Tax=Vigna unguiculata TaxID=3917 RepID=UPI0010167919|nr:TMV resistance protein N-like isoform X2 [Vigna unguiculata]
MEFASSSSNLQRKYDVLIHFDGEDIRRKFVSHLDFTLSAVGLTTFLHQENAVKGMKIQEPILDFCRVAIVVFTKTYSESAWCLHQLQQIIQWHETYSRHVLPVYYEIQPSDVRLQKGHFGKAFKATAHQTFSGQELEHGMCRWSRALTKVANFFGWDDSNYRSDAELVDRIVKSVLNLPILSATEFPVGLESQVKDVIRTIKSNPRKVCIIGIWGMRGSGKTTLAKAIYNQIHGTFTEKSFIENISDFSQRRHLNLQKRLLSDILKTKINIHSVEMGRSMIRERLYGKRVLIVLDDMIDEHYPLLDLRICRASLGGGSVIILTTRYKDILRKHGVDAVFGKNLLNSNESLELFSWHAFREAKPKEEYHFLAKSVVAYCEGNPLSLEVIGSYLYERTKIEWHRVLLKLIEVPQFEILPILKISFDGLRDQTEKDLFLDICCFFVGKGRAYVTKILNGCGIDADCGIRVLLERSLIKVKRNNKFGIHPLVRDMGREIIDDISRKEPRKNRWLWLDDDMKHAPSKYTTGYSKYLSKKLRCISLQCFSSEYLCNDFYLHDAIVVDLKRSLLGIIWKQPQGLASSESCDVFLPGGNDPYWLVHMGEGHSVSFTLPKDHVLKGMALCAIYSPNPEILTTECLRSVLIVNYTKCTLQIHYHGTIISFNDIDWQGIISNLGSGDRVEIFVIFCDGLVVKRTVVYLICGESNDLEKEPG